MLRRRYNLQVLCLGALATLLLAVPLSLFAQENNSLTLSVTPPLFQLSVEPGDRWQSSVKVINSNPYDITIYADAVNFAPQGESGNGRFLPVLEDEAQELTFAGWITITDGPIVIPREQSKEINFVVDVPEDAPPGGHFAAILIGTEPPRGEERLVVKTSQVVTSLFFVRIAGDIVEDATIREFSTPKKFNSTPNVDFILRVENKGNVHVQPQGNIVISNMWGKERGFIPINQQTRFGNVLPDSIRRFEFSWEGEPSITDIGRYSAEAVLTYGQDGRKNISSKLYFWVVPVRATLITLGSLVLFILFMTWAIRSYVRRALVMAGVDPQSAAAGSFRTIAAGKRKRSPTLRVTKARTLSTPMRAGIVDLRLRLNDAKADRGRAKALMAFVFQYKIFFGSVLVGVVCIATGVLYVLDVRTEQRSYEVTIDQPGSDLTITSEEVLKERISTEENTDLVKPQSEMVITKDATSTEPVVIELVNASGVPGTAAKTAVLLESLGYVISSISTDEGRIQKQTTVLFSAEDNEAASELAGQLGSALLSVRQHTPQVASSTTDEVYDPTILVIVGSDQVGE